MVIANEDEPGGWCWINMAHATTRIRPLVRAWAVAAISKHVEFDALHLDELAALLGAEAVRLH